MHTKIQGLLSTQNAEIRLFVENRPTFCATNQDYLTEGHKKKLTLHGIAFGMHPKSRCTGVT